jgi:sugar phosphate isomerase/epimerase
MWIKPGRLDLTYCTNIHSGESWQEVRANIASHCLSLKSSISHQAAFGIGLRLSAAAAEELLQGSELQNFKAFLDERGLYVALINGFPYGSFNCGVVKSKVFAPDWREDSRVRYTLNLIRILANLLPAGIDGGISTMPLSYKPWISGDESESKPWQQITANLTHIAEVLVRLQRETGKIIHLDIEPEPDGLVENTAELIRFFNGPLTHVGVPLLAGLVGISKKESKQCLFDHIRVCFDTCHISVEYEDPIDSFQKLADHGIGIGRIQVSSALHVRLGKAAEIREQLLVQLKPFAESVYLHQVIEQDIDFTLHHYPDLSDALASPPRPTSTEWRIHYHVPIFMGQYGSLSSNQQTNREVLSAVANSGITSHLEIETYTWDVLPSPLKIDLLPSIEREYRWVLNEIGFDQWNAASESIQGKAIIHE